MERGHGLQIQIDTIQRHCAEHGLPLLRIYQDGGYSGAELTNRPALQECLANSRDHTFKQVIVTRLDRAARNAMHTLIIQHALHQSGVELLSLAEPHSWTNPTEKVFMTLLAAVGELERAVICQRLISGRRKIAELKKWPGGRTPFGFLRAPDGHLTKCAQEADVLSKILHWRYARQSFGAIAKRLNELGIKTRTGRSWDSSTVAFVSRNPAIRGNFRAFGIVRKNTHESLFT
jgi:site-specific DNA recombinase